LPPPSRRSTPSKSHAMQVMKPHTWDLAWIICGPLDELHGHRVCCHPLQDRWHMNHFHVSLSHLDLFCMQQWLFVTWDTLWGSSKQWLIMNSFFWKSSLK
jgi:hypothetical protein